MDKHPRPEERQDRKRTRHKGLCVLVLAVLLSRLVLLSQADYLSGDDGLRYMREGANLWRHEVFSHEKTAAPRPTAHDTPIYPLVLWGLLELSNSLTLTQHLAGAINAVLFAAMLVPAYFIALLLTRRKRAALMTTCCMGVLPAGWPYSVFSMPESLFLLVFLSAVLLGVFYLRSGRFWAGVGSLGLLGVATLIKPIALLYPAVLILMLLIWRGRRRWRRDALMLPVGLLVMALVLLPWLHRNYRVFGHVGLTTISGTNLFYWNYRMALEEAGERDVQSTLERQAAAQAREAGPAWENPFVRSQRLTRLAKGGILRRLPSYAKTTLRRHPRLYLGTGSVALLRLLGDAPAAVALERWAAQPRMSTVDQVPARALVLQIASWLLLGAAYALAVVGAIAMARRRQWVALAFLLLSLLYFAVLYGPVVATRYRLVMLPFIAVLTGAGLSAVVGRLRRPKNSRHKPAVPLE